MKPEPIECSICGEMIEPVWDCGTWLSNAAGPILIKDPESGEYEAVGGKVHATCMEHAALWRRIKAIEEKLK